MPGKRAAREQRKRHDEVADWIFRNKEPRQTAAEKAAFREWLDRDPENRSAYEAAERLMGEARTAILSDPALRDFEVKPRNVVKPVAGSLLALALAGSLFFAFDGPMRFQADMIAGTDEMPIVTLADGSTVQLNASSAVAYHFDDGRRTFRLLRGQAFFEVVADPDRPFTVEAGAARVTALGTAFDVRLGDAETDVTVTQNAVLFEFADGSNAPLRVEQGERASWDRATGARDVGPADSLVALAWRRGQLIVDDAPLSYVVEEMSRHFSGRIVIAGSELSRRRVYEINGGAITIDGIDIRDMALKSLRSNIGIVSQDVFLFAGTIRDNIAYGRLEATEDEIAHAARLARLDGLIASLPAGLDTIVGERGVKLSGGQKQRVAIARIFLKNPPILILDEATSALDTETEQAIRQSLDELARGRTTLVIAHRLATVVNADRILVVEDGRIVEEGSHRELIVCPAGRYSRLHWAHLGEPGNSEREGGNSRCA